MKTKASHGFKAGTVLHSTRYTAVSAAVVSGPKPPRHLGGCKFASVLFVREGELRVRDTRLGLGSDAWWVES